MVSGVIQARMNATRLPGKTLMTIDGRSLLAWTIDATNACPSIDNVIVATSENPDDTPVAREASEHGAEVFRGDEDDVLGRYVNAIDERKLDVIVRICGDSPLFSPWVADGVIQHYHASDADYASNLHEPTFPWGTQVEVFTGEVLQRSAQIADRPTDHEHVTPVLRRRSDLFSNLSVVAPEPIRRGRYRLCVDTQTDYEVICEIFESVEHPPDLPPDLLDVVQLLDRRDDLTEPMYEGKQKYSTSEDTSGDPPTVELSMDLRERFHSLQEQSMTG